VTEPRPGPAHGAADKAYTQTAFRVRLEGRARLQKAVVRPVFPNPIPVGRAQGLNQGRRARLWGKHNTNIGPNATIVEREVDVVQQNHNSNSPKPAIRAIHLEKLGLRASSASQIQLRPVHVQAPSGDRTNPDGPPKRSILESSSSST
jgi:hypothetical protein